MVTSISSLNVPNDLLIEAHRLGDTTAILWFLLGQLSAEEPRHRGDGNHRRGVRYRPTPEKSARSSPCTEHGILSQSNLISILSQSQSYLNHTAL